VARIDEGDPTTSTTTTRAKSGLARGLYPTYEAVNCGLAQNSSAATICEFDAESNQ